MAKQYRLVKGVPGCRAGTIGTLDGVFYRFPSVDGDYYPYTKNTVENDPDFFEPVKDEQSVWPKVGDTVYSWDGRENPVDYIWLDGMELERSDFKSAAHRDGALEWLKKYRKGLGYES